MTFLISIFWFIRTAKVALFYIYLWQLKEYQVKRFLDHFQTDKGKKLIFNQLNFVKLVVLAVFLVVFLGKVGLQTEFYDIFLTIIFWVLFLIYFIEVIAALKNIFQRKLKLPVFTIKVLFLLVLIIILLLIYFVILSRLGSQEYFILGLLCFDILTPLISSLIVLLLQPFAVLARNQTVKKARAKIAKFPDLKVVGITGSYAKTSTKEILTTILSQKFKVLKTKAHQNSEIGIAKCILRELKPEHQIFVCEMASYGKGGIKLIADMIKPKIGIVAGINEQHLALFGSMENLISAEGGKELVQSLPPDGKLILNWDSDLIKKNYVPGSRTIRCSTNPVQNASRNEAGREKADFWAEEMWASREDISFKMFSKNGENAPLKVNLLGGHNAINILMAAATAKELGMSFEEIVSGALKIKQEQGAMRLIKNKDGFNIIDSIYSANPDGVLADLEYLKVYPGKKVVIMPCLIELGPVSKDIHKKIGKKIGEICNLAIITAKECFEDIKKGAKESGMDNIFYIEEIAEILRRIEIFCVADDVVLLEGRVPKGLLEKLTSK